MLGTIIGDIVGAQFQQSSTISDNFELFSDDSRFTGNTVCTIAIADAIMNHISYKDALNKWCRMYPEVEQDYSLHFRKWLHSNAQQPYGTDENQAAVRACSVGWLFHQYKTVQQQAQRATMPTHCNKDSLKGATCIATVIYWLRTVRLPKEDLLNSVKRNFYSEVPSIKDIQRIGSNAHFDSTCNETVVYAIRCFIESNNFEDALRKSVLCKGDMSTKTALVGAMAEACYDIPDTIARKAYALLPTPMLNVLEQYYDQLQRESLPE